MIPNISDNPPEDLSFSIYLDQTHQESQRQRLDRSSSSKKILNLRDVPINKTPKEKKSQLSFNYIRPCLNTTLIPDNSVTKCYTCNQNFSWFLRKHHCRACGRIFCYRCSSKSIIIPKHIEGMIDDPNGVKSWSQWNPFKWNTKSNQERVCDDCYHRIDRIYQLQIFIIIFSYLELKDLYSIAVVCKNWSLSVNICKSIFRDIQYILPSSFDLESLSLGSSSMSYLSPLQRRLLWTNRNIIYHHNRLLSHLLINTNWHHPNERETLVSNFRQWISQLSPSQQQCHRKKVSCWTLMCTRTCRPLLSGYDAIQLLAYQIPDPTIYLYLIRTIDTLSDEEFEIFSPLLVFYLRFDRNCQQMIDDPYLGSFYRRLYFNDVNIPVETSTPNVYMTTLNHVPSGVLNAMSTSTTSPSSTEPLPIEQYNENTLFAESPIKDYPNNLNGRPRTNYSDVEPLLKLLLKRSRTNIRIRGTIYWTLHLYKIKFPELVFKARIYCRELENDPLVGKDTVYREFGRGQQFILRLAELQNQVSIDRARAALNSTDPIPLPLNPEMSISKVYVNKIQEKQSSTSPLSIPVDLVPTTNVINQGDYDYNHNKGKSKPLSENKNTHCLLLKRECVFKDYIIMRVIRFIDHLLKSHEKIDFGIQTYNVLPIDHESGLIEIVPNAETLYSISKEFTLLNYMIENNKNLPICEIRERFIRSSAAYSVISYLLGVGDRHLDNIMITHDGRLFHIDYGYILGRDPKPMAPAIRVTQDIVDAMGGLSSSDFLRFRGYCSQIYNCVRKYTHIIYQMLSLLTEHGLDFDRGRYLIKDVRTELLNRFIPYELSSEAESQILIKIDDSYSSYTPRMFDVIHYTMKEKIPFSRYFPNLTG